MSRIWQEGKSLNPKISGTSTLAPHPTYPITEMSTSTLSIQNPHPSQGSAVPRSVPDMERSQLTSKLKTRSSRINFITSCTCPMHQIALSPLADLMRKGEELYSIKGNAS